MSFMRIQFSYERFSRLTDEIAIRRQLLNDVLRENPEIEEQIPLDTLMTMDLFDLHAYIEQ